ncbi:MAG: hypothetical protein MHM6MM_008456, partial [Cercozoa sp. M6MM]
MKRLRAGVCQSAGETEESICGDSSRMPNASSDEEYEPEEYEPEEYEPEGPPEKRRRTRGSSDGVAGSVTSLSNVVAWEEHKEEEQFSKALLSEMKAQQLRDLCRARGLPVSGTKAVLLGRILGREVAQPRGRKKKQQKGSKAEKQKVVRSGSCGVTSFHWLPEAMVSVETPLAKVEQSDGQPVPQQEFYAACFASELSAPFLRIDDNNLSHPMSCSPISEGELLSWPDENDVNAVSLNDVLVDFWVTYCEALNTAVPWSGKNAKAKWQERKKARARREETDGEHLLAMLAKGLAESSKVKSKSQSDRNVVDIADDESHEWVVLLNHVDTSKLPALLLPLMRTDAAMFCVVEYGIGDVVEDLLEQCASRLPVELRDLICDYFDAIESDLSDTESKLKKYTFPEEDDFDDFDRILAERRNMAEALQEPSFCTLLVNAKCIVARTRQAEVSPLQQHRRFRAWIKAFSQDVWLSKRPHELHGSMPIGDLVLPEWHTQMYPWAGVVEELLPLDSAYDKCPWKA